MNIRDISAWKMGGKLTAQTPGPIHQQINLPQGMSRRGFTRTAGGAAVLASTVGLWKPTLAQAKEWSDPQHLPGGTPVLGGGFHVFGPAAFDPVDAEPAKITDFNGFVGLAYISGMVTQTNNKTGEKLRLPFVESDMRFMQGVYKGQDGRMHQGALALV